MEIKPVEVMQPSKKTCTAADRADKGKVKFFWDIEKKKWSFDKAAESC